MTWCVSASNISCVIAEPVSRYSGIYSVWACLHVQHQLISSAQGAWEVPTEQDQSCISGPSSSQPSVHRAATIQSYVMAESIKRAMTDQWAVVLAIIKKNTHNIMILNDKTVLVFLIYYSTCTKCTVVLLVDSEVT